MAYYVTPEAHMLSVIANWLCGSSVVWKSLRRWLFRAVKWRSK